MRIGLMLRTLDEVYGIGLYTRYVLEELLRLDRPHEYVLMYRNPAHLGSYAHHPHVKETVVRARGKLLWDQVAVPRLARQERLDVLFHSKFTVPFLAPCKTVMVLHGSEWFVYPEQYHWWDIQYIKVMMPFYVKRANAIISVSNRAKEDIAKYTSVDPDKVRTVYLAANERFGVLEDEAAIASVRKKYDLPEDFIVFVGKIYPGKNLGNVLRALARLKDRVPHKLVVCGDVYWNYEKDLKLIDELGLESSVLRLGRVSPEDLPAIYNMASLLLFPSFYESCPAPPWEAMACACPVVTAPTGGTPEVVGDAAVLVDPHNVEEIADATYRVLTDRDLRASLVERGFRQVRRFSWRKCASETLQVIEDTASN